MMGALGLGEDIADELARLERMPLEGPSNARASRLCIVQHHQAVR